MQPRLQGRVGRVHGRQVVGGHLLGEGVDGGVDEEGRHGGAGAAPDDVGRGAAVPRRGAVEHAGAFGGDGQVRGDVAEALGGRVEGGGFDLLESFAQDVLLPRDDGYVGAFGGEEAGDAEAHSLGASCDESCLFVGGWVD